MTGHDAIWRLNFPDTAKLACGPLTATLHLDEIGGPALDITSWHGKPLFDFALSLGNPQSPNSRWPLRESYVRGNDLVASFEPLTADQLAPQVYWRTSFDRARSSVGIEWIVSLQTDLLDSRPGLVIKSFFRNTSLVRVANLDAPRPEPIDQAAGTTVDLGSQRSLLVARHKSGSVSYAEMPQAADCAASAVSFSSPDKVVAQARTTLITDRLEKGVIRRARLCGWFLPAENDLANAVELAKHFIDEPLPLTA